MKTYSLPNRFACRVSAVALTLALSACGGDSSPNSSSGSSSSVNGGVVTTLAGTTTFGFANGNGIAASFNQLLDVAADASGNVFVADTNNHMIRKITPAGDVTTFAGSTTSGQTDANGSSARFNTPGGLAVDTSGNVFVADSYNHTIRKITPSGDVSTLAGSAGNRGSADGTGGVARFSYPSSVAVDTSGNVWVTDSGNNMIRKVTPSGVVSTVAGSTTGGNLDGNGTAARFNWPSGAAFDSVGNFYVADYSNNTIRKVTPVGVVTTLAGVATAGSADGTGSTANFRGPLDVAIDANNNIYVADNGNHMIRKVTIAGVVTTLAGTTTAGSVNGTGAAASFSFPYGVAVDSTGVVYVADYGNNLVRKIQ